MCADIAQPLLQQVQERAADNSLTNIKTQLVNAVDLSFAEDCSFDAISFSLGLQFVPDKARYCFPTQEPALYHGDCTHCCNYSWAAPSQALIYGHAVTLPLV